MIIEGKIMTEVEQLKNMEKKKILKYCPSNGDELSLILKDDNVYLGSIDVSKVANMSHLFSGSTRKDFSGIEDWDVSNVKNMSYMFTGAKSFNQDISSWDVSNVKDVERMFFGAKSFNQDLSKWNVSNVKYMLGMFSGAKSFNQDLNKWDVSNVETIIGAFKNTPLENNPPSWYINLRNKL